MKAPPLLLGAALLFWGWQTDFLIASAAMAVLLESARFVKARWELSNEDFRRIWTFCTLLFLATAAYAFASNSGPAKLGSWVASGTLSAQNDVGNVTTKTAVLLIRWSPMAFFLFMAAQALSDREGIPLETVSLILRRRWKRARKAGQPPPNSGVVNVSYPYFITCLFAASSHPVNESNGFFWGLCALLGWAFWAQRSHRFGLAVWAGTMVLAIVLGYGGLHGLVRLKQAVDQYNAQWLGGSSREGFDPLESRTEIGQIGRLKTSSQIVIRLETPNGRSPPAYLREAGYRTYKSAVWYAASAKDDFTTIPEEPVNSGTWPLLPGKTNTDMVNIACYLPGGKGLLPMPASSGQLDQLPAFELQKNGVGAVRAEGPGLVIFNARYGPGAAIDHPPDANEDLAVPDKEKAALDQVIYELHLDGQNHNQMLQAISHYFGTKFAYSLWQEAPRVRDTNRTALSRFLLKSHRGHCEYFASATVLLLRQLGIPARYNVGYAVHETSGNKYVVRQNDAHAWCRVWNAQKQNWEDFDTTPGTWEAMERQQRSAFQFISDGWSRMRFEFSKIRWGQSHLRQYILWALVPILALLLFQIVFRTGKRRKAQGLKSAPNEVNRHGLDSEFYQLERALAKRGLIRHSSEPASVWLRRIAKEPRLSEVKGSLLPLAILHYRYRFDPQGLSDRDRAVLRREVVTCLALLDRD